MKSNSHKWYSSSYLCAKNEVPVYFYCRFVAKLVIKHESKLNPVEVVTFLHPSSLWNFLSLFPRPQAQCSKHWGIHNLQTFLWSFWCTWNQFLNTWGNEKGLMALKIKVVKKAVEYFWEGHAVSLWSEVVGSSLEIMCFPRKSPKMWFSAFWKLRTRACSSFKKI